MSSRFEPDYPIQTERLNLRPHRLSDLEDLCAFHSDPEVVRYIPWPVRDREQTRVALLAKVDHHVLTGSGQWLVLAVELRARPQVIGEVLLKWESEIHRQGEIGFAFNADFHGEGLAREAAAAVIGYGFATMKLHRIVGRCDSRNDASARLMAKLGMRPEALLRENEFFKGEWTSERVLAILRSEWEAGT